MVADRSADRSGTRRMIVYRVRVESQIYSEFYSYGIAVLQSAYRCPLRPAERSATIGIVPLFFTVWLPRIRFQEDDKCNAA